MPAQISSYLDTFSLFPSFEAQKETCRLMPKGVAAIFGPQSDASADHIRSIADLVEIPYIDTR